MKIKTYILILIVFTLRMSSFAEKSEFPSLYNSYDGRITGARAIALGGAFTALADDPTSPYWNPAGLEYISENSMNVNLLARRDLKSDTGIEVEDLLGKRGLSGIFMVSSQGAISWQPIANYEEDAQSGLPGSRTAMRINKYMLSWVIPNSKKLTIGVNLNYLHGYSMYQAAQSSQAVISNGSGWGADWGFLFKASDSFKLGLMLRNAPSWIYWDKFKREKLPFVLNYGFCAHVLPYFNVLSEVHVNYYKKVRPSDLKKKVTTYHFGIEQIFAGSAFFRSGMYCEDLSDLDEATYSLGVGYKWSSYTIDIAAVSSDDISEYWCSLSIPFK